MEKKNRYVCDACGKNCKVCSCEDFAPLVCMYSFGVHPNWRKDGESSFEKDDEWRSPYVDDEEYISKLTDEEKNEIIRNHFDCRMDKGCPCYLDPDYKCEEWKAYCKLTGSDGSDFEFDDCWFRSNEHRCLTDYVLWKLRNRT